MAPSWVRVALSIPLGFSILVLALGLASLSWPLGLLNGLWVLSLLAPLIALAGTLRGPGHAGLGPAAVVAVCAVLRCVLFVLHLVDSSGSYYVWPVDAVLSLVLLVVGWKAVGRRGVRSGR